MKQAPGYPLPAGELGSDDIVCQLVYLPDRPEYWQAFISSLHYLATWRAWERDDDKRGKDAAANWREANELTMECWRMACLQDLQDDVAAILAIMQIPQACCDPGDFTDGDQYTDRVEDGEGDVPQNIIDAGYASDTSDWDGFDDYKCMIAHVSANQLEERLREIAPLVDIAGGVLGGVAALAGILAVIVGTGGLAIVFGIVAGIGATALLYQAIADFGLVDSLADKVATNHNALACAIYNADGDTAALTALNLEIDALFTSAEALILKNMNMGPTIKSLYSGRYDQQDIAEILFDAGYELGEFDCSDLCNQVGEFYIQWDFAEDEDSWNLRSGAEWSSSDDGRINVPATGGNAIIGVQGLRFEAGLNPVLVGGWVDIHRVSFWYKHSAAAAGNARLWPKDESEFLYDNHEDTYEYKIETFDPPLHYIYPEIHTIRLDGKNWSSGFVFIKDVTIDFDANVS